MRTTLALLTLGVAATAHASSFHFAVPPGWIDLSPGAPPGNMAKVPPALAKQIEAGNFVFYAADVAHADDGFMENVNATRVPGSPRTITTALLDGMMAQMGDEVARQMPGARIDVVEKRLVEIGGVTCGRVVALMKGPGLLAKQVQFVLPGDGEAAVVTYSTTPEKFAEYEPVFDRAVAATTGLVEPRSIAGAAGRGAIIGGIAGGAAVLLLGLYRLVRRRRA